MCSLKELKLFHNWKPWTELLDTRIGAYLVQFRVCAECNKAQIRYIAMWKLNSNAGLTAAMANKVLNNGK